MKFSIITPSLNNGQFIRDTIQSVLDQDYRNFEHIIIDGGSTDETIPLLKKYSHLRWISEEDTGQSNAINKGFKKSNGDVVAWLNSDDYYERNIFSKVAEFFKNHPDCRFLYGDITLVNLQKAPLAQMRGANLNFENLLKNPDIIRQPSCFWRKEAIAKVGMLQEELALVMDYDFLLRTMVEFRAYYINENLSYFRVHEGCKTKRQIKRQHREIRDVMKKHTALYFYYFFRLLVLRRYYPLKHAISKMILKSFKVKRAQ
jgi:glycosyltransferase involved in cell wall biosynthesis